MLRRAVPSHAAGGASSSNTNSGSLADWDSLAASLPADIPVQPKMLQGGNLREYQMQVWVVVWAVCVLCAVLWSFVCKCVGV